MTLLAADAAGCAPIVISDIVGSRLDFAKKLIPRVRTVLISGETDGVALIQDAAATPIKVALECTGQESSIATAIGVSHAVGKSFGFAL